MRAHHLPVPTPIGARLIRWGPFYRADLLTQVIDSARALAELAPHEWTPQLGQAVGESIRRFQDVGVCHADLNARNILIDANAVVHWIDFDRARIRSQGQWQQRNIQRLLRSCRKLGLDQTPQFGAFWSALMEHARA
jgi:3-deoxy-D-manno-octulosonic acid kinase